MAQSKKAERRQAKKSGLENSLEEIIKPLRDTKIEGCDNRSWATRVMPRLKDLNTNFENLLASEIKPEKCGKKSASKKYLGNMKTKCKVLETYLKKPCLLNEHKTTKLSHNEYKNFCEAIDPLKMEIDRVCKKRFLSSARLHSKKVKGKLQEICKIFEQLKEQYATFCEDK